VDGSLHKAMVECRINAPIQKKSTIACEHIGHFLGGHTGSQVDHNVHCCLRQKSPHEWSLYLIFNIPQE